MQTKTQRNEIFFEFSERSVQDGCNKKSELMLMKRATAYEFNFIRQAAILGLSATVLTLDELIAVK